jgi:hypothetical protein
LVKHLRVRLTVFDVFEGSKQQLKVVLTLFKKPRGKVGSQLILAGNAKDTKFGGRVRVIYFKAN